MQGTSTGAGCRSGSGSSRDERIGQHAAKTAGKVATDERTFDEFLEEREQWIDEGMYPSRETMVEFVAWLTRRRERVCLAQRVES